MTNSNWSEDDLDILVSIAIMRAESLDETGSPAASEAWAEVMAYEMRLAEITRPDDLPGGLARVGAVTAGLAAGRRVEAIELADRYLAEPGLSPERSAALSKAKSCAQ